MAQALYNGLMIIWSMLLLNIWLDKWLMSVINR